jgi:hypothetical protein
MVPFATPATVQPIWVHTALKALNSPALGWVTTTFAVSKTVPPPHRDVGGLDHDLARACRTGRTACLACRITSHTAGRESSCADDAHAEHADTSDDCTTIHALCCPLVRGGELVRMAHEVLQVLRQAGLRCRCPPEPITGSADPNVAKARAVHLLCDSWIKERGQRHPLRPKRRLRRGQSTSVACISAPVRLSRLCGRHITTLQHNRVKSPTLSRAGLVFTPAVGSAGVRDGSRAMTIQEETCISVRL